MFKIILRQLIPLTSQHVLLKAWRKMAVMSLNHANACAHLHSEGMYIHPVVEQGKGRIGVTQAVERSVLPCAWTSDQPCVVQELTEGLVDVFADSAIGQSEHG